MSCPNCEEVKEQIQSWADKQGHERCWYYPTLFRRIAEILGVKPKVDPDLPPLAEFEAGCRAYQMEQFPDQIWAKSKDIGSLIEMYDRGDFQGKEVDALGTIIDYFRSLEKMIRRAEEIKQEK